MSSPVTPSCMGNTLRGHRPNLPPGVADLVCVLWACSPNLPPGGYGCDLHGPCPSGSRMASLQTATTGLFLMPCQRGRCAKTNKNLQESPPGPAEQRPGRIQTHQRACERRLEGRRQGEGRALPMCAVGGWTCPWRFARTRCTWRASPRCVCGGAAAARWAGWTASRTGHSSRAARLEAEHSSRGDRDGGAAPR